MMSRCLIVVVLLCSIFYVWPSPALAASADKSYRATASPGLIVFQARNLEPNQTMEIDLPFAAGALLPQGNAQLEQRHLLPYLVVPCLLLAILMIALGCWLLSRRARKYHRPLPAGIYPWSSIQRPPDELSPALATLLASNSPDAVGWKHFQATLLDLINRGVLVWHTKKPLYTWQDASYLRDFLARAAEPTSLQPHERALLDILFKTSRGAEQDMPVSNLYQKYLVHAAQFKEALLYEVQELEWLDPQRQRERFRLGWMTISLLLLTLLAFIITFVLMGSVTYYYWCLFFPDFALLIVTIGASNHWQRFSVVRDDWLLASWRWHQFALYISQIACDRMWLQRADSELVHAYFPYAAGLGLADGWIRQFYLPYMLSLPDWFPTSESDPVKQHAAFERALYAAHILLPRRDAFGGRGYYPPNRL